MSDKKENASNKTTKLNESFSGIAKLSPEKGRTLSLNGINNLSPQNLKPSSSNSSQNSCKRQSGENNTGKGCKK